MSTMALILESENWTQAQVAHEFQALTDEIVNGGGEAENGQPNGTSPTQTKEEGDEDKVDVEKQVKALGKDNGRAEAAASSNQEPKKPNPPSSSKHTPGTENDS